MKCGADLFKLDGKTALVTGATGHLGRSMAAALAQAGAHVLVNSRSAERCAALVSDLAAAGGSAEAAVFDVADDRAVDVFFAGIGARPLHILLNNAYAGGSGSIKLSSASDYQASYGMSVVAAHATLKAALSNLRAAVARDGDASVINVASMYGIVSPDMRNYATEQGANPPFYGAAKAALIQWTRYAACEFGPERIRVNSVSPGPFPSKRVQQGEHDFVTRLASKVPMGRIGDATEIGGPILFLASSASSYVNGANLVVDGGWTCW